MSTVHEELFQNHLRSWGTKQRITQHMQPMLLLVWESYFEFPGILNSKDVLAGDVLTI